MQYCDEIRCAFAFAKIAHGNQVDRGGTEYMVHLRNVWQRVADAGGSIEAQQAAILHDVLEDTNVTVEELAEKFGWYVTNIVGLVSKNVVIGFGFLEKKDVIQATSVDEYFSRIKANDDARLVKLADLNHNLDLSRLKEVTDADIERFERYTVRYKYLMGIVRSCY